MIASGATRTCKRARNEDRYHLAACSPTVESPPLYLVADGMGGATGGEVASRIAVEACLRSFFGREGRAVACSAPTRLRCAWEEANRRVLEAAERRPELRGMGTTMTGFALVGGDVWVAHVGDSRCYALRSGELVQLTQDHSVVAEAVRRGAMTTAEAEASPQRNAIYRAVGTQRDVRVDLTRVRSVALVDAILLCSDGLTGTLPDERIRGMLVEGANAGDLVTEAEAMGAQDNATAVVVRV